MDRTKQLGYILGWLILGPIIVIISTILCPFVLSAALFFAAKNNWPKVSPKIANYGLTPPPKEIIILN
jgi:hypothetical protein